MRSRREPGKVETHLYGSWTKEEKALDAKAAATALDAITGQYIKDRSKATRKKIEQSEALLATDAKKFFGSLKLRKK